MDGLELCNSSRGFILLILIVLIAILLLANDIIAFTKHVPYARHCAKRLILTRTWEMAFVYISILQMRKVMLRVVK